MSGSKRYPFLLSLLLLAISAQAAVITFDDYSPMNTQGIYTISTGGLTFASGSSLAVWGSHSPNSNGTPGLINASYAATITLTAGGAFNLQSFDMTLSWSETDPSQTISVEAQPSAGGVTTQYITLLQGLQTYDLNLNDVIWVSVGATPSGQYWLMDNVTYNTGGAIPEPGTFLLAGSLLALLGLTRLRRRA